MTRAMSSPARPDPVLVFDRHRGGDTPIHAFGYAGANAGALKHLTMHLPARCGFSEFVSPGRGRRFREPPATSLPALCAQAAAGLPPQAGILFGYSLGALLAYETARMLQAAGRPPRALVACALNAPHRLPSDGSLHRGPLPLLRDHLARLGGTPREVLDDLSVLACFEPTIRADYQLIESYRHAAGEPLRCPIIVMGGTRDALTNGADMTAWSALTSGRFTEIWIDSGHFFLDGHADAWRECFELANSLAETFA